MRFQKQLALCLALATARPVFAADPAPADKPDPLPSFLTTPSKSPVADPDKPLPLGEPLPRHAEPPQLLPDDIPAVKRPAPAKPPTDAKPGTLPKTLPPGVELDLRIRYRKARNIAETNEQVRLAWEATRYPKNDQQKRTALKRYYDLLFAKMLAVDRGIAPLVEKNRKAEAAMLTQRQIAPTVVNE